jgi:hypothetical protein
MSSPKTPKKVESAPVPPPTNETQIRILPVFDGQKKSNVIQITVHAEDGSTQIVDQEFFSGSNLWFTRRAKRALNKISRRQMLVAKFFASIQKPK